MKRLYLLFAVIITWLAAPAQNFVTSKKQDGDFAIASPQVTSIYIDKSDDWLVNKAALLLQGDI